MSRSARKALLATTAAALGLLAAAPASSVVIGDFEGSFDGWTTSGGAVTTETSLHGVLPTLGNEFLQLRTQGGVTQDDGSLDAFFGFAAGTIDALSPSGNDPIAGAGVLLVFDANAGDRIEFDYNFLTREDVARSPTYRDFYFSSIRSGEEGEVVREDVEAMTRLSTNNPNWEQSGWQTVSYTFTTTGTFTLGFGVLDVGDKHVETRLLLDNLRQTPEPSTGVMVMIGVLGLAMRRRRELRVR